jgi:sorbitol-specific phosphotransferase system component IIA
LHCSCVFDSDLAASSGGAVIVEGAIDPETAEPTTARFHDCVFTRAFLDGALFVQ